MSGDVGVGGVGDVGEGKGWGEGSVCDDIIVGGSISVFECYIFVLDFWYFNKSLLFMFVFFFCILKWWGVMLVFYFRREVGKGYFFRNDYLFYF